MTEQVGHWRATYTPGNWIVLSGPTSMVVLQPAPAQASGLLNSMWDEVLAGSSLHDVAQRLAAFNADKMPSFAAFFWGDGSMRSLVRGRVKVMDLSSGQHVADGEGVQTWTEVGLGDLRQFRVDMEGTPEESTEKLQLPLVVGAVTASAVVLDASDQALIRSPQVGTATRGGRDPIAAAEPVPADSTGVEAGAVVGAVGTSTSSAAPEPRHAEQPAAESAVEMPAVEEAEVAESAAEGTPAAPTYEVTRNEDGKKILRGDGPDPALAFFGGFDEEESADEDLANEPEPEPVTPEPASDPVQSDPVQTDPVQTEQTPTDSVVGIGAEDDYEPRRSEPAASPFGAPPLPDEDAPGPRPQRSAGEPPFAGEQFGTPQAQRSAGEPFGAAAAAGGAPSFGQEPGNPFAPHPPAQQQPRPPVQQQPSEPQQQPSGPQGPQQGGPLSGPFGPPPGAPQPGFGGPQQGGPQGGPPFGAQQGQPYGGGQYQQQGQQFGGGQPGQQPGGRQPYHNQQQGQPYPAQQGGPQQGGQPGHPNGPGQSGGPQGFPGGPQQGGPQQGGPQQGGGPGQFQGAQQQRPPQPSGPWGQPGHPSQQSEPQGGPPFGPPSSATSASPLGPPPGAGQQGPQQQGGQQQAPQPGNPVPAGVPEEAVDHDGATVFATSLARSLKATDTGQGGSDLVLAALCNLQHPNPPQAQRCSRCGGQVPPQNPRLVTRPVLATLKSSSGDTVDVDRAVRIGRSPSATRVSQDKMPRLMTVPSPSHDISRTHVEVEPDGWNLRVTDQHSTNGTTLVITGPEPERRRLVPGEPAELRVGWILDLGDGVTVSVENPAS